MPVAATNHWKLGLFVVLGVATSIGLLFWVGARGFRRESFPAVAYFDESVQGLDVGSPVKFRGVSVGTVADITIAPDRRLVQVTSAISLDALRRLGLRQVAPDPHSTDPFIAQNLRVQLAAAGITGVRFLQIDFFDPQRYPPPQLPFQPPWNYVPSAPSTLKSLEEALLDLMNRLPTLGDRATDVLVEGKNTLTSVRRLAGVIEADNGALNDLLVRLRSAASRFETAVGEAELGSTTTALRAAAGSVGDAAGSVGNAANGVNDARDDLRASLIALRETLESTRAFVESLDRDPSALVRGRRSDGVVPSRP